MTIFIGALKRIFAADRTAETLKLLVILFLAGWIVSVLIAQSTMAMHINWLADQFG